MQDRNTKEQLGSPAEEPRDHEARKVIEEYANGLREIIDKLRRRFH